MNFVAPVYACKNTDDRFTNMDFLWIQSNTMKPHKKLVFNRKLDNTV